MKLTQKKMWENRWFNKKKNSKSKMNRQKKLPFHSLLVKYLPKKGSILEIGCAPGRIMIYFKEYFGFKVAGLDYSSLDITKQNLDSSGVLNYKLFNMDFTKQIPPEKFDIVTSFGFIEHFTNVKDIIEQHFRLVNNDGFIVIGIPNYRWGQFLLHYIFDRESMLNHNLSIMKPLILKKIFLELGAKQILYCGYCKTFRFWQNNESLHPVVKKNIYYFDKALQMILNFLKLDNIPNFLFSPYILIIGKI